MFTRTPTPAKAVFSSPYFQKETSVSIVTIAIKILTYEENSAP